MRDAARDRVQGKDVMNAARKQFKWALAAATVAALALALVPAASSMGQYTDLSGDSGSAGDLTAIMVASDPSGQVIFHVNGNGLSSSPTMVTFLFIDSDANPLTGDTGVVGADYVFGIDDSTYWFGRWDGSDWVYNPHNTVRVSGGIRGLMISVNRSELGNTSEFNFWARSLDDTNRKVDDAPDDGAFNYSMSVGGVHIVSVLVATNPVSGPKAGKSFSLTPVGLKLPPDGRTISVPLKPDSYSCKATLKGRKLASLSSGRCTWRIPKNARGKPVKVVLTVTYQGTTASFPYVFTAR
jgi:hypothetical protein